MDRRATTGAILAVDIGGTKMAGGIVDREGRVVAGGIQPTEASVGRDHIVQRLVGMSRQLLARGHRPLAVGIGAALAGFASVDVRTEPKLGSLPG